jgi:molybdopterin molybdotransferase
MPKNTRRTPVHALTTVTPLKEALQWIDRQSRPLPAEAARLAAAFGRVLAADVHAPIDAPPFDRVTVDGYAVQGMATVGASTYHPLTFVLPTEAALEHPPESAGTATPVTAGAALPQGADAVVPATFVEEANGQLDLTVACAPGTNTLRRGMEFARGTLLLSAGRRLAHRDLALMASVGMEPISVIRQPRVRVVVTGSELIPPGRPPGPDQVIETNAILLHGLIARDGGAIESIRHVPDDWDAIEQALLAPGADILLVAGGSGGGSNDYTAILLADEGELAVHGLALWPASSAGVGRIAETPFVLLPGDPVSCLCAYDVLGGRAVRLMSGYGAEWPYASTRAIVAKKIVSPPGRVDYCRVRWSEDGIEPVASDSVSNLYATAQADGFILVPEASEGYAPGAEVTLYWYDCWD